MVARVAAGGWSCRSSMQQCVGRCLVSEGVLARLHAACLCSPASTGHSTPGAPSQAGLPQHAPALPPSLQVAQQFQSSIAQVGDLFLGNTSGGSGASGAVDGSSLLQSKVQADELDSSELFFTYSSGSAATGQSAEVEAWAKTVQVGGQAAGAAVVQWWWVSFAAAHGRAACSSWRSSMTCCDMQPGEPKSVRERVRCPVLAVGVRCHRRGVVGC